MDGSLFNLEGEYMSVMGEWRRFESIAEIEAVEGYVAEIDDAQCELKQLIGWYAFNKEEMRCGRRSCHRAHRWGFVVRDVQGRATNIGHICGEGIFGEKFAVEYGRLEGYLDKSARIESARELLAQREHIMNRVEQLRRQPKGIDWAMAARTAYLQHVSNSFGEMLIKRGKNLDADITITRERTDNDPPATNPFDTSIVEKIGRISGIGSMGEDVGELTEQAILKPLRKFGALTPEAIVADRQLKKQFTSFINGLSGAFLRIEGLLRDAARFYTSENHREVQKLADGHEQRRMAALRWDRQTGLPIPTTPEPLPLSTEEIKELEERRRYEEAEARREEAMRIRSYFK